MDSLKKIFQFYVFSNVHVSLSVWSMAMLTGVLFRVDTNESALFVGVSTFTAYNWIRYLKYRNKNLRADVFTWFEKNIPLLFVMNFISLGGLLWMLTRFQLPALLALVPFVLLTLLYVSPIELLKNKRFSLRSVPGLKIFCISISWAGIVVLFPLVQVGADVGVKELLFFVQQIVFVFVLTLPFDLRDSTFDADELSTIPQVLGGKRTKILGFALVVFFWGVSLFLFEGSFLVSALLSGGVQLVFLLRSTSNQSPYFASFWVEGIPVFWFAVWLLLGI